ncbi:HEAT repeat domain-containing protein [bacterium]|nr:HEAT repeat domain-containing protein [bacterium]
MEKNNVQQSFLRSLVFDLEAYSKMVKISAISQLQAYINEPIVVEAVRERIKPEEDPECLQMLRHLSHMTEFQGCKCALYDRVQAFRDDEFVENYLKSPPSSLFDFIDTLKKRAPDDATKIILGILNKSQNPEHVFQALDLNESFYKNQAIISVLSKLVSRKDVFIAIRALQILVKIAPETCLSKLPILLTHQSSAIRIASIRALHSIFPSEALRLLEEFVASCDSSHQAIALRLMFAFPFEEISHILFSIIETEKISVEILLPLEMLIKSNPDPSFLARLASLNLRNHEVKDLSRKAMKWAAEALSLSGIEEGSETEIQDKYLRQEKRRLEKIGVPGGFSPTLPSLPSGLPSRKESDFSEEKWKKWEMQESISKRDISAVLSFLESDMRNENILRFLHLVRKHSLNEERIEGFLEKFLDSSDENVLLETMDVFSSNYPRKLVPHLAVLANNSSQMVATQAIRNLRRIEKEAFLRRIRAWISNSHNLKARNAAIIGLMQVDFFSAKNIIFPTLQSTSDCKLIEALGTILLMNPERQTLDDLRRLSLQTKVNEKKEAFTKLLYQCESNFKEISKFKSASESETLSSSLLKIESNDTVKKFLQDIRDIHYSIQEGYLKKFFSKTNFLGIGALAFSVFAIFVGFLLLFRESVGVSEKSSVLGKTFVFFPKESLKPPYKEIMTGTLESFDPLNRQWKVKTSEGGWYKIKVTDEVSALQPGDQVRAKVSSFTATPLGYIAFEVSILEKVKKK